MVIQHIYIINKVKEDDYRKCIFIWLTSHSKLNKVNIATKLCILKVPKNRQDAIGWSLCWIF